MLREGEAVLTAIYLPCTGTCFVLVYLLTAVKCVCIYVEEAGDHHLNGCFSKTQSSYFPWNLQFSVYFKTPLLVKL